MSTLEIKSPSLYSGSPEMCIEALRTMPIQPRYGSVQFRAEGIVDVKDRDGSSTVKEEAFWKECERHDVIPGAHLNLEFLSAEAGFVAKNGLTVPKYYGPRWQTNRFLGKALMEGKRPNSVTVSLPQGENVIEAFEMFRHGLLQDILSTGQKAYEADLWFLNDSNKYPRMLFVAAGKERRLALEHINTLPQDQAVALSAWWLNLPNF